MASISHAKFEGCGTSRTTRSGAPLLSSSPLFFKKPISSPSPQLWLPNSEFGGPPEDEALVNALDIHIVDQLLGVLSLGRTAYDPVAYFLPFPSFDPQHLQDCSSSHYELSPIPRTPFGDNFEFMNASPASSSTTLVGMSWHTTGSDAGSDLGPFDSMLEDAPSGSSEAWSSDEHGRRDRDDPFAAAQWYKTPPRSPSPFKATSACYSGPTSFFPELAQGPFLALSPPYDAELALAVDTSSSAASALEPTSPAMFYPSPQSASSLPYYTFFESIDGGPPCGGVPL
ncbi:hypothetical protein RQP46_010040 [Phenoliferia psychrophenolica]